MDERTHARYMSDIAYFLSKMEAEPNSGYFIPIALAYNKLEKYDETIAMCKSAIERFPANCAAKTFLAEAYVYKGQFDLARDLLFDVTAEDDNNYKALKLLGIICKENGDTTDALKYLTGAYIRSPEDEDVRKMIEELGGSLNPAQIYDERMKRQSQNNVDSEEDEELRTYQEIDQRIRNAEIIMADLVSDTTISARDYSAEEDFYSDNPNDFMPLITQHEEEEEELSDDPNDFLPTITQNDLDNSISDDKDDTENSSLQTALSEDIDKEESNDLLSALSEDSDKEESNDLLSALSEDSDKEESDDLLSALSEDSDKEESDDLLSALSEESDKEESNDLLSALSEDSDKEESDDLLSALSEDIDKEESDDLLSALSEESDKEESNDLLSALSEESDKEENHEEAVLDNADETSNINEISLEENNDSEDDLNALPADNNDVEENEDNIDSLLTEDGNGEDNIGSDELSLDNEDEESDINELSSEENNNNEDILYTADSDEKDILDEPLEQYEDKIEELDEQQLFDDSNDNISSEDSILDEQKIDQGSDVEDIEDNEENILETTNEDSKTSSEDKSETKELSEHEKEVKDLYNRKIPSSVVDMTYDDMIDDDFKYGSIVDESYRDNDNELPNIDLGESAPFTQGDIMDEILGAVGMTQEDMTNDEEIEFSDKEKTLEKLEQFLDKVRNNKEHI